MPMSKLKAGFGRVNITPMLGIDLDGYYQVRKADGVLDELEANAIAFACEDSVQVFVCLDMCAVYGDMATAVRQLAAAATGIPVSSIHIGVTHSHTTPIVLEVSDDPLIRQYTDYLKRKVVDVVALALADLKPATLGWAVGRAPHISFVRRFRMKDGSIRTNPGVNNPDIATPIGEVDERVNVLRLDQQDGKHLIFVNFATHPDTIGGCKISCDWPGFARRMVEKALDDTRCIFFNGAEGDVNHVNVRPAPGDGNDLHKDFDDVDRGYGHARHMGNVIAGAVLQVYDKVSYIDADSVRFASKMVRIPSNRPVPEEMPEAHRINDLYIAGREHELPYEGMMLTTVVAEAARKVLLEHGPDYYEVPVTAVAVGNVALLTMPGEAFTEIGCELKKAEGWDLVTVLGMTDESVGYFPVTQAYIEGGYEARSSKFKQGVAEILIGEGKQLLSQLRK